MAMLTDSCAIISLFDADDDYHSKIRDTIANLNQPLITTWPVITEASYFLTSRFGMHIRNRFLNMLIQEVLVVHEHSGDELNRIIELMLKYEDVPMDLADSSLVAAAEALRVSSILTVDSHFRIYRLSNGKHLNIVP